MSLSKRQKNITDYLSNHPDEWLTGKELSQMFEVSLRTIRNDIAQINIENNATIIESSKNKGYHINESIKKTAETNTMDFSNSQRRHYLFFNFLIHKNVLFNYFDLAEELFVSEYTVLHDIDHIKQILLDYSQFEIFLERKNNTFTIVDSYNNAPLLLDMYIQRYNLYDTIEDWNICFENCNIKEVKQCIVQSFPSTFFNRYLTFNTVLIISLLLIEQQDIPMEKNIDENVDGYIQKYFKTLKEKQIIHEDSFFIPHFLNTILPLNELHKAERIIKETTTLQDPSYQNLVDILNDVKEQYNLDLTSNTDLILNFLIHIKIARLRLKNKISINNPLLEHLRQNYTFLFDVAFYIAKSFSEKNNLKFTKMEISYFVIYLIGPLKSMKENLYKNYKVNIVIHSIEGLAISNSIKDALLDTLDNFKHIQIQTVNSWENLDQLSMNSYDLLITTSSNIAVSNIETLQISSSFNIFDSTNVINKIKEIFNQKRRDYFERLFNYFFNEQSILIKDKSKTKDEYLKKGCEKLLELNYVKEYFYDLVLERENLLSTSFNTGIALPHATKHIAIKSNIQFTTFENPIPWNENKIKCSFLFAIQKEDIQLFNVICKLLISISSSSDSVNQLSKCTNINDLKTIFLDCYEKI